MSEMWPEHDRRDASHTTAVRREGDEQMSYVTCSYDKEDYQSSSQGAACHSLEGFLNIVLWDRIEIC